MLVAKPAEIQELLAASESREDLVPVPCPRGEGAMEALAAQPPDVAVVRLALAELDGLDLLRRIRARSPQARVIMLLDPADARHRETLFRASADDVVFTPLDGPDAMVRLVGGAENRFRKAPRVPFAARGRLLLPAGEREVTIDSVSELGVRLRWTEAPPSQNAVRLAVELMPGSGERMLWVRFQDLSSRKGVPEALLARFIGLSPEETTAVRAAVDKLRGSKGASAPLESAPTGPAKYEPGREEGPSGAVWQPLPPAPAAAPSRGLGRRVMLGIVVAGVAASGSFTFWQWRQLSRPDLAYEKKPVGIYEGLRIRRFNVLGTRMIAMADASWEDLDEPARKRAIEALTVEARSRKGVEQLEVWTLRGKMAAVAVAPVAAESPAATPEGSPPPSPQPSPSPSP